MSPHKIEVLPSPGALASYDISKNGFLPEEPPLLRLPQEYYEPWECIISQIHTLIKTQRVRPCVDELPVLDTCHLQSEAEWRRTYSILTIIAQGYIWQGPEPSHVSCCPTLIHQASSTIMLTITNSVSHQPLPSLSCAQLSTLKFTPSPLMLR